jgi:hypothetical protein
MVDVLVVPLSGRENCSAAVGDAVLDLVTPPIPVGPEYVAAELLPVSLWVTVMLEGVGVSAPVEPVVDPAVVSMIFSAEGWFDSVVAAEAASGLLRLVSVTVAAPDLPLEVPVVPPGDVPVVAAMMVLLKFIPNTTTRGLQAGSLASIPVLHASPATRITAKASMNNPAHPQPEGELTAGSLANLFMSLSGNVLETGMLISAEYFPVQEVSRC